MKNSLFILLLILIVACADPEPRKPIVRKTSTFLKESIARNKAINKAEETELKRLMDLDSLNEYIVSPNGFWYYYNVKDAISNRFPVKGDEVTYEFEITDIYGDLIYSKEELGQRNYLVDKEELITGLQDGIKLMKEGETVTFLFPSHKAYGYSGYQKIGSNQPLRYTVTLKKITTK